MTSGSTVESLAHSMRRDLAASCRPRHSPCRQGIALVMPWLPVPHTTPLSYTSAGQDCRTDGEPCECDVALVDVAMHVAEGAARGHAPAYWPVISYSMVEQ